MAGTSNNSVLYILDTSNDLITIRSSVVSKKTISILPHTCVGSIIRSNLNSVPFGNTTDKQTGAQLLNLHEGLWSISFKWKIVTDNSTNGNGINYVRYGISNYTGDNFELFSKYRQYNYDSIDYRTWEEYADSFILNVTSTQNLYLNAYIDNSDPFSIPTGIIMTDCLITATLIKP